MATRRGMIDGGPVDRRVPAHPGPHRRDSRQRRTRSTLAVDPRRGPGVVGQRDQPAVLDAGLGRRAAGRLPGPAPRAAGVAQVHRHPLVRHYQVAPDPMPRTVEDLHRDGRWPDEAAQHAVTEYLEADRHLAVQLPAPPGEGHVIVLGRAGRGFTDRDRHLAARWQPLLAAALNQQRQIDRWRAQASAAQGVPPEAVSRYRLTPREVAVLTLLGDALTATAIARRLTISPRTVHRHIDSIYRKLRTNDRLATVLRARDEGLLADPNRPRGVRR